MANVYVGGSWRVSQLIRANGLSSWSVNTCQRGSAFVACKKIFTGGSFVLNEREVHIVEY